MSTAEFGKLSDLAKFALDDVRQRQKAILDLVYAIDRQAMTLLGFSVTLSVATGSGAFIIGGKVFIEGDHRPFMVSAFFALMTLAVGFIAVACWCLAVMKSRNLDFAGRNSTFWLQVFREGWDEAWLIQEYLNQVATTDKITKGGADEMAKDLRDARGLAVATFLTAVGVAALAPFIQALAF
ncbi:hypothetical protein [Bosea sp. (in: a-proteobacteria)]|uniref:hypothetical protein n=1 Tax=Bosea sp. (in: a-proteobacteria) TaxID=1871050 RepID=UPI0027377774|nr:hypothetical protein [Bosea sp. (in: a-proteobacteria)]MDP3410179.1 hypothetical protein [Bosea sp. (in: a-proteobacteria)]